MAILGIRKFIKSKVKDALGIDNSSVSAPQANSVNITQEHVAKTPAPAPAPAPEPELKASDTLKTEQPLEDVPVETLVETTPSVEEAPATNSATAIGDGLDLTVDNVQEILDDMVRPALQGDGGDISLIKIEENNIYVKLVGACSTCPSSVMTMKMGVEALLKEEFPSMNELVDITAVEGDA